MNKQLDLIKQKTSSLIGEEDLIAKLRTGKPRRVKLGVDPTIKEVTLGWAVVLRKLRQLQDLGHTPCLVIGDFTATIGDPSGKSKTRKQLTFEEVQENSKAILDKVFHILDKNKTEVFSI
jgi:tyrosyl-tRNA synthetase